MIFPQPDQYDSWQSWALELIKTFEEAELGPVLVPRYRKAKLPPAAPFSGAVIFVLDEVGGSVPAFSDGTAWRRVTDRVVVS